MSGPDPDMAAVREALEYPSTPEYRQPGLAALDRLSARIKELEAEIERLRERSGIHD